jgi:alcohol dehydrogenase class IV
LELNVRSLSALGIPRAAFDEIVVKATGASSMKANPVALAPAELKEILVRAG